MVMADSVTEELRRDILGGVFMPGERLIELQLSERYECGRAAVREALVQLESEGLVERQANRGAIVRRVSISEAIEITEARSALESLITARAARRATGASDRREPPAIRRTA
jgi:DNA-binding GntR family transcriptional regulator